MDENLKKVMEDIVSRHPKNLVEEFKVLLREAGVDVRDSIGAKYFRATKNNCSIVVLAHESNTKQGWWGILKSHVDELKKEAHKKEYRLAGWGAALIHTNAHRGYWIRGEDFVELCKSGSITLNKKDLYEINENKLEDKPGLALRFFTIKKFLTLSGLAS